MVEKMTVRTKLMKQTKFYSPKQQKTNENRKKRKEKFRKMGNEKKEEENENENSSIVVSNHPMARID